MVGLAAASSALIQPGTPARDVTIGLDNDTADNQFIQPPGVPPAHMNGTDVLFGRDNQDLLIGNRGSDTLLGGSGGDILVGGPDRGPAPGNDVLVGDLGNDIAVWSPGDRRRRVHRERGQRHHDFAPGQDRVRRTAAHLTK